ncbi:MAG: hypothetical protein J0H49_02190 [Acidobacteria bacterium]|nr:hypothetical protein [Acidobacteriota bacterium]
MIALSPKDSAVLGDALQYKSFPLNERLAWLSSTSKEAQSLGKYMLGVLPPAEVTDEIREAARMVEKWLETNRKIGEYRKEQREVREARFAMRSPSRASAKR